MAPQARFALAKRMVNALGMNTYVEFAQSLVSKKETATVKKIAKSFTRERAREGMRRLAEACSLMQPVDDGFKAQKTIRKSGYTKSTKSFSKQ